MKLREGDEISIRGTVMTIGNGEVQVQLHTAGTRYNIDLWDNDLGITLVRRPARIGERAVLGIDKTPGVMLKEIEPGYYLFKPDRALSPLDYQIVSNGLVTAYIDDEDLTAPLETTHPNNTEGLSRLLGEAYDPKAISSDVEPYSIAYPSSEMEPLEMSPAQFSFPAQEKVVAEPALVSTPRQDPIRERERLPRVSEMKGDAAAVVAEFTAAVRSAREEPSDNEAPLTLDHEMIVGEPASTPTILEPTAPETTMHEATAPASVTPAPTAESDTLELSAEQIVETAAQPVPQEQPPSIPNNIFPDRPAKRLHEEGEYGRELVQKLMDIGEKVVIDEPGSTTT